MKLKLANDAEALDFSQRVDRWWENGGKVMFESAGFVAKMAVAEYMANLDGLTLYATKVGK